MSYYYNYYIGYIDLEDGKIYPLGPYNSKGSLCAVISRSRSFASDLHEVFYHVPEDKISEPLREKFEGENWEEETAVDVRYLPVEELPSKSFIRSGYFLIDEVKAYESDEDGWFDGFSNPISPDVYAAKLQHEMMFGKNKPEKDCEGEEYTPPNASDYMYYAYPDYSSREYEAHILKCAVESLESYNLPYGTKCVILEDEG